MDRIIIVFALVVMVLVGFGEVSAQNKEAEENRIALEKSVNETPSAWKQIASGVNGSIYQADAEFVAKEIVDGETPIVIVYYRENTEMGLSKYYVILGNCDTNKVLIKEILRGNTSATGKISLTHVSRQTESHTAKKGQVIWEILKFGCLQEVK